MSPFSQVTKIDTTSHRVGRLVSKLVGLHGLFVLALALLEQIAARHNSRLNDLTVGLPLLIGLSLVYLSTLLARYKRHAWVVAVFVYAFLLGLNTTAILNAANHHLELIDLARSLLVPVGVLALLIISRREFAVRSDIVAWRSSLRFALAILLVATIYGAAGFILLDESDFHEEFGPVQALHRTLDQFDLTTTHPLVPYTKRAQLFEDSLTFVSIGSLIYVVTAFFQPLKSRFVDQAANRQRLRQLLQACPAPSEDFFKLWPHDKQYFFDSSGRAALAFRVQRGVALCLGDPVGDHKRFKTLLRDFEELCYGNDWTAAFIHTEGKHQELYGSFGYKLQKIGQEAVVDIAHFERHVAGNKYFRNIQNRFNKLGYECEVLSPPHHVAVLERLGQVSQGWLARPGRNERRFVMGYFSYEYMQQCQLMVAKDAAGTIQGFLNLVPAPFDGQEATFDLLRHSPESPANLNDYLLVNFLNYSGKQGYQRLNLGLCPLTGLDKLDKDEEQASFIDNFLHFVYANGDRFYSFSGLHRFKAKYQPAWSDRYIVYKGNVRVFSRVMNALMRAVRVRL
ncbi:MAG TPA: phosphatidylglycerol lysyltransferase domain-containing protein [Candidatus Saccharimonadales bacterium]|nr:phosphatidylglycerol lysyltransferase domain-containing protein [Candidatus Saccharimonadales bacterium]